MMKIPYYWQQPYRHPQATSFPHAPPQKRVITIPVHSVESNSVRSKPDSKSESASKIQKVFRGFRVRNCVKKIMAIRREVEEMDRNLEERETVDRIKRVEKERLKFNESLMALLLKLDSVKGVDVGVRDFRKAVIRKVIALQEKTDSLISGIGHDDVESRVEDPKPEDKDEWLMVNNGGEKDDDDDDKKRRKERFLEKIGEDNEMIIEMLGDLCERNAVQANLIASL